MQKPHGTLSRVLNGPPFIHGLTYLQLKAKRGWIMGLACKEEKNQCEMGLGILCNKDSSFPFLLPVVSSLREVGVLFVCKLGTLNV